MATFPAGTLSGAPKIRAMEIIDELEPVRRGVYGGTLGYFDLRGNADFCIAIRTLLIEDGRATVQAGAGIVADSDPAAELRETEAKAEATLLVGDRYVVAVSGQGFVGTEEIREVARELDLAGLAKLR